jgi:hypothetical protein
MGYLKYVFGNLCDCTTVFLKNGQDVEIKRCLLVPSYFIFNISDDTFQTDMQHQKRPFIILFLGN